MCLSHKQVTPAKWKCEPRSKQDVWIRQVSESYAPREPSALIKMNSKCTN